jgi:hypothetical protein
MGRNYLLVPILLMFISISTSFAKNNALTIESYGVAQGSLSGEYERKLTNKMSFAIQGLANSGNRGDLEYKGFGGGLGIKYYLSNQALRGAYIGVLGTTANLSIMSPTEGTVTSFGVAGSLGFKWVFTTGFAIDVGFSLAMPVSTQITILESGLQETIKSGSIGKGINLGLGIAW